MPAIPSPSKALPSQIPLDLLWQKRVYKKDDARELYRLLRTLERLFHSGAAPSQARPSRGRSFHTQAQNCVVKCRIGYDKQTHLKFISEYLPQLNKKQVEEKPTLFGGESADSYLEHMAGKHFKFIVSPESQRVDNEALVRTLVKRLEKVTGCRFRWLAACHTDTAHNHAHLLINGVDAGGREVSIDPPFIRHTIRGMTRQICTEMIGGRTPEEISASKQIAYKSARYCFIDKTIEERSRPGPAGESLVSAFDELTGKRLDYLRSLGLARNAPGQAETADPAAGEKSVPVRILSPLTDARSPPCRAKFSRMGI
ncbi:MAG: DUF3363 domain-containing protein [Treponematales bacterium]